MRRSTRRHRRERKRRKFEQQKQIASRLATLRTVTTAELFAEIEQRLHIISEAIGESNN